MNFNSDNRLPMLTMLCSKKSYSLKSSYSFPGFFRVSLLSSLQVAFQILTLTTPSCAFINSYPKLDLQSLMSVVFLPLLSSVLAYLWTFGCLFTWLFVLLCSS